MLLSRTIQTKDYREYRCLMDRNLINKRKFIEEALKDLTL